MSDVSIGIVDDAHLDARHGPPECAGADLARLHGVAQHANHLGHSPELDHGKAEALLERRVQLGLDAGADAEPDLVLPFVHARRELQQNRRDHPEIMDDVAPVSATSRHQRCGWKRSGWIWQLPVTMAPISETTPAFA